MFVSQLQKAKYHKTQLFDVHAGVRVDKNRDGAILDQRAFPLTATHPLAITRGPEEYKEVQDAKASAETTMSRLPAWIAYDRKVCFLLFVAV